MKNRLLCGFLFMLVSCQSVDDAEVKKKSWKNNDGAYIRDVIVFGNEKNDGFYLDSEHKVYYYGKYVGKIINANDDEMIILTPKNEKSYYVSF